MITSSTTRLDAVVIGAGQAGLATSYYLSRRGIPHTVLESHARVGDQWRQRWDALRLFSPAAYNALPGWPFPAPPNELPDKNAAADYLESYARHFALPIETGVRVEALHYNGQLFELHTNQGLRVARQVVVASGAYCAPNLPHFSRHLPAEVVQLHSSQYVRPSQFSPGSRILVVGAGASGLQIARDLQARGHQVGLVGRDPGSLPRRKLGIDIYWWLYTVGPMRVRVDSWLGRWWLGKNRHQGDLRVGDDLPAFVKASGITYHAQRLVAADPEGLTLDDGTHLPLPQVVVWCTGYRPDYNWIDPLATDPQGWPQHQRGVSAAVPGLYFVGLPYMYRLNSSLMGGVGADARYLATQIARRQAEKK